MRNQRVKDDPSPMRILPLNNQSKDSFTDQIDVTLLDVNRSDVI